MFEKRLAKKMSYGIGFLGVAITAVVVVLALITNPPLPSGSSATPIPTYQSIQIEQVDSLRHGDTVDVVARVKNPNPHAGIANYNLEIEIVGDQDRIIAKRAEKAYIIPGSTQYLTVLSIPVAGTIKEVRVVPPADPTFTVLPEQLSLPNLSSYVRERAIRDMGTTRVEERKGVVTNNGTLGFERIEVTAVGLDKNGRVASVGKTFVGKLMQGEQREFTIQWLLPSVEIAQVIVLPTTNVFEESNITKIIGDPASLR